MAAGMSRLHWRVPLAFAGAAALVFVPQLLWNWHWLGSPFTFGYAMHARDAQGFEWAQFAGGAQLASAMHQQLFAVGGLGLLLARRRRSGWAAVAALTALPLLIFYCGYHALEQNPVRYLLLPLVVFQAAAAVVVCDRDIPLPLRLALLAGLVLSVPGWDHGLCRTPLPVSVGLWWWGAFGAAALCVKARWEVVAFALLMVALSAGLAPAALAWALTAGVIACGRAVRHWPLCGRLLVTGAPAAPPTPQT
jgi:hypothetical protein